ncbi:MAG TPA: hypothetical protein VFC70_03985 [Oscillospiraceae bacterium]|nr:hypothetical protein [Oscillospiraceae bacterium]
MEEKTFKLIERMYNEFSERFEDIDKKLDHIDKSFENLGGKIKKIDTMIEHETMPKITVLFDGQKQHTEQLERIGRAVSRHEDFIVRRIK